MSNSEPARDARTTPRWARIPVLLLLGCLFGYEYAAYHYALDAEKPGWLQRNPYALWPATWQMFTYLDRRHNRVDAEVLADSGEWVAIDLEEYFPYRWESGPRYARSSFRKSPTRMRTLAQATCHRIEPRPDKIRFKHTRWGKTLGSKTQPPRKEEVSTILTWDCEDHFRLPKGEVL